MDDENKNNSEKSRLAPVERLVRRCQCETKEPWFSRSDPPGYFCAACGGEVEPDLTCYEDPGCCPTCGAEPGCNIDCPTCVAPNDADLTGDAEGDFRLKEWLANEPKTTRRIL